MARLQFSVQGVASKVVFGAGSSGRVAQEVEALGLERVLVVCTEGRYAEATQGTDSLGASRVGVLTLARQHVPTETVAQAAVELERAGADAVLAWGGGSAV